MASYYEQFRDAFDTGDIILFSGKGGVSDWIKLVTRSQWSHVGMVIRLPQWKDAVLIWESTTLSNIVDVESGKELMGVQLVSLSERLKNYNGEACFRRLKADRTPQMFDALEVLRIEVRGRAYEKNYIELIKSAYDGPLGQNKEDLSSLFCSELVAEAYQRMGLLPNQTPSNEYTPWNFSAAGQITLLNGATLDPEIPLKT